MKNKRLLLLVVIVSVIGLALVLIINNVGAESNAPQVEFRSSDWETKFLLDNKDPQGLYVFRELMIADGSFTAFNEYSDYQLLDSISAIDSSVMMYIGQNFTLTDPEIDLVLKSVYQGNEFFLSSEEVPTYLFDRIFEEPALQFIPKVRAPFKIKGKTYDMYSVYEQDTLTNLWMVFQRKQLSISRVKALTTIHNRAAFIEIPYGEGEIFLHLNPTVFMNYQLLRSEGQSYLKHVFSELKKPHVQWLTFAKFKPIPYKDSSGETPPNVDLLKELSKNPAFRWGFVFAVFGWILYLLFRSKRRHPIIPAVETYKNSGYSYVDTLAGIFYSKNHSTKILKIMRQNFHRAVWEHFYIDLSETENKKLAIELSKKSNVPVQDIEALYAALWTKGKVNDDFLVKVYNKQRSFYFQSGIWDENKKQKSMASTHRVYYKKAWSIGTILGGVYLILQGFYLLTLSIGVGVLFWPIGIITCVLGTRMLNTPAFEINEKHFKINGLIKKKTIIFNENISFIERKDNVLVIHQKDGKSFIVNTTLLTINNKIIEAIQNRYKN